MPKPAGFPRLWNLLICSGMASRERTLQFTCHRGTATGVAGCPFRSTEKESPGGNHFGQILKERPARRLRGAARNSELMHSLLERGSLHSKTCRCAIGTGHNPIAVLKGFEDVPAFGFLQNVMKRAICRFRRGGLFYGTAVFGKSKITHIDTQHGRRRDDYGTFDHILKFSYVPRPVISAQGIYRR